MPTSPHQQRILTGLLLTVVLVACLVFGGWWIFLAVALFSCWGLLEFYQLFWPGTRRPALKALGLALGLALLAAAETRATGAILAVIVAAFWLALIAFLLDPETQSRPESFTPYLLLPAGILYVPAMLQFFLNMQLVEIVLVLAAAFLSDTGAFYAGSRFGKHKLWPRVSPKKTWEGSLGGLAACAAITVTIGLLFGRANVFAFLLLALPLNIAAQLGDLVESAIKRGLGVKDAGRLLPGHGGLLDRIDGLLLVAPTYAALRAVFAFF